jgi:hypothetical protein
MDGYGAMDVLWPSRSPKGFWSVRPSFVEEAKSSLMFRGAFSLKSISVPNKSTQPKKPVFVRQNRIHIAQFYNCLRCQPSPTSQCFFGGKMSLSIRLGLLQTPGYGGPERLSPIWSSNTSAITLAGVLP